MTDLQERILKLVDEIDRICKKQGLRYILGERTAGLAALTGSFLEDSYEFSIHMPLYDAAKLREYTRKHLSSRRVVESWADNGSLKRMMFRYVDKESLLIDEMRGEYFKCPGIAVTIYVARSVKPDKRMFTCENYLMKANSLGQEPDDLKTPFHLRGLRKRLKDESGIELAKRKYRWGGRDRLGAFVLDTAEKAESKDGKEYWHLTMKGKWYKYPDGLFEDVKRIPFEGKMLPITDHLDDYMKIVVGKAWRKRCLENTTSVSKHRAILECDMPYEEFLEFTKDDPVSLEMIINERKQYARWKLDVDYVGHSEKVRLDFRKVRASQVRIDLWYDLRSKREALASAYEKGDVESLTELMEEYLADTDMFYKDKLGFYIDDELLEYAGLIWESQGKPDYKSEVYDLVPQQWKDMDLEAHLTKYLQE